MIEICFFFVSNDSKRESVGGDLYNAHLHETITSTLITMVR